MKIAQLVSNYFNTSTQSNHGIYYHVGWLVKGLVDRNNDVTLFGSGDSDTPGKLFSVTKEATRHLSIPEDLKKHYLHLLISQCYQNARNFDIIHAHFNILSSFYANLVETPTVQSIHSPIGENLKEIIKSFKNNYYISFSLAQRKQIPDLNWVANIYHGVDMKEFGFNPLPKDYVLYLGRITEDKGVHIAIEAAKAAKVPLVIAGRSFPEEKYWHEKIEPQIDGKMVSYVGEANFQTKVDYLQNARALLLPVQWEEPFGLVMIEAMACGTPIIGFKRGSIPEVVQDRWTGYVVNKTEEMVKAIESIDKIDREACRKRAELFFSIEKMVKGYEKVYMRVIEEHKKRIRK